MLLPLRRRQADVIRRRLLAFYDRHRRDLPWRGSRDPYAILVSEVMLQQTTVAAEVPNYERFLARFPDLRYLSRASEEEVLTVSAGLGYIADGPAGLQVVNDLAYDTDGVAPTVELSGSAHKCRRDQHCENDRKCAQPSAY